MGGVNDEDGVELEADRARFDAAHPGQEQSSQKPAITRATADLAGDGLQEFGPQLMILSLQVPRPHPHQDTTAAH